MAKIRVADLIQVSGLIADTHTWWKTFSGISQKHVDFVLCDPASMNPLIIIELDDMSHLKENAKVRDELVNSAFKQAGYPMLRIPVGSNGYDAQALSKLIEQTQKRFTNKQ